MYCTKRLGGGEKRRQHVGERAFLGEARARGGRVSARNHESSSPTALLGVAVTAVLAFGPKTVRTHAGLHLHDILDLRLADRTFVRRPRTGHELHESAGWNRARRAVDPRALELLCGQERVIRTVRNRADGHRPRDKISRFAGLEAALHFDVLRCPLHFDVCVRGRR